MSFKPFANVGITAALLSGCALTPEPSTNLFESTRVVEVQRESFLECVGTLARSYHTRPQIMSAYLHQSGDDTKNSTYIGRDELPHTITTYFEFAFRAFPQFVKIITNPSLGADLFFKGSINLFDRAVEASKAGIDGSVDRGPVNISGGASREAGVSVLAAFGAAYDAKGEDFPVPLAAMFMVRVAHASIDQRLAGGIGGVTVGASSGTRQIQPRHFATVVLAQWIVAKIMSTKMRLPYWRCVEEGAVDPIIKDAVLSSVRTASAVELVKNIQELAVFHGEQTARTGLLDTATVEALERLVGEVPAGDERAIRIYLEGAYWQLYEQVPADPTRNREIQARLDAGTDLARGKVVINAAEPQQLHFSDGTRIEIGKGQSTLSLPIGDYAAAFVARPTSAGATGKNSISKPTPPAPQRRFTVHPSGETVIQIAAVADPERLPMPLNKKQATKPGR